MTAKKQPDTELTADEQAQLDALLAKQASIEQARSKAEREAELEVIGPLEEFYGTEALSRWSKAIDAALVVAKDEVFMNALSSIKIVVGHHGPRIAERLEALKA